MVSTTLTTLVSQQQTSGGQNNQHHHQYQRQQPSSSSNRTTYYYPSSSSSSTALPGVESSENLLDLGTNTGTGTGTPSPQPQIPQHHQQPQSATEAATTALKNELNLLNSSPPLNEQISILFPKCRPKSEYHNGQNQHHQQYNNNIIKTPTTVGHIPSSPPPPPSTASSLSSESLSSVTPRISTNPFLNSAGNASSERYYYPTSSTTHTTSSTTTSASMKHYSNYNGTSLTMDGMTRKRGSTTNHYYNNNNGSNNGSSCTNNNTNGNNSSSSNSNSTKSTIMNGGQNPFIKDNYNSYNNTTPASTVLNSPELTDYESRNYYYTHNKIRLGRSPVNRSEHHQHQQQEHHNSYTSRNYQQQQLQQQQPPPQHPQQTHHSIDLSSPTSSPTDGLNGDRDGITVNGRDGIVVFDDISENWQNLRVTTPKEQTLFSSTMTTGKMNHRDTSDRGEDKPEINNCDIDSYKEQHKRFLDRNLGYKIDSKHGIIEYEGSPRRIGQCIIEEEDKIECITSPDRRNYKLYHTSVTTPRLDSSPPAVHLPLSARPGFPQRILSTSPPPLIPTTVEQLHHISTATPERNQLIEDSRILVNDDVEKTAGGDNHNALLPTIPNTAADDTSNDVSEIGTSSNSEQLQLPGAIDTKSSTFDYLYEFSETRKVLEEFFKCPSNDRPSILENGSDVDSIDIHYEFRDIEDKDDVGSVDIGRMDDDNNSLCNNQHHHHPTEQEEEEDQQLQNHDGDDEDDGEDDEDVDVDVDEQPLAQSSNNSMNQNNTLKYSRMNGTNGGGGGGSSSGGGTPFGGMGGNLTIDKPCISRNEKLSRRKHHHRDIDFFLDSASRSSCEQQENPEPQSQRQHSKHHQQQQVQNNNQNQTQSQQQPPVAQSKQRFRTKSFRYSPDTTDCDSNCGDLDSLSGEFNGTGTSNGGGTITKVSNHVINYTKHANHMPCLEDGLSSGHTSDADNNNPGPLPPIGISMLMDMKRSISSSAAAIAATNDYNNDTSRKSISPLAEEINSIHSKREILGQSPSELVNNKVFKNIDPDLDSLYSINVFHRPDVAQQTPPPPAPAPHRKPSTNEPLIKDLRPNPTHRMKPLVPTATSNLLDKGRVHSQPPPVPERTSCPLSPMVGSPVWIPRDDESTKSLLPHETNTSKLMTVDDEDDIDTDLETDRLLGHQRLDDQGFFDDKKSSSTWDRKSRSILTTSLSKFSPKVQQLTNNNTTSASLIRQGLGNLLTESNTNQPITTNNNNTSATVVSSKLVDIGDSNSSPERSDKSTGKPREVQNNTNSPDGSRSSGVNKKETSSTTGSNSISGEKKIKKMLIEGVLFRARYLGSTQLICEGQPTKSTRMMQAEEAVSRIKALAPDGDAQPSTEVDLFISTEKIMVLNTDLKEIMMDHALRTISYIADIGDLVVLMARRRFVPQDIDEAPKQNRAPKMICHVFESDEAQFIAQSIGQAFQVAYMEFLKANGIEDHSFVKEMDYQEVLNSQEIFGDELEIFAKKELQKEVVVPKAKGEILGVVIVESGWGSMLPTVVIANLMSSGAAARCGQLNIGDQLIAINGLSLVGLPLSTCQSYIKNTKNQTVVKFTVVPCAPVVEVKIKRPNTKYQLGFSVQNGVICSLLRGGIAERGGVRVGHRIIEINNQSVVAVPHEKIVNLLATSVGEILMKTMPTSMFRLLTGQENPIYI